jgi:predicted nucleotidyltransferase
MSSPTFDPRGVLEVLAHHEVRFIVIGAVAAIFHGYPLSTQDLDVTPSRAPDNLERLARALQELDARLRVSRGRALPFPIDAAMLSRGEIWTLTTKAGPLDLVYFPAGTRGYDDLQRDAREIDIGGATVTVASLADVIRSKEAANRPKDIAQLPALRQTLEVIRERERGEGRS